MATIRDLLEQGVLMGLGAVALTRETAQHMVDEMIKRGQAQREEASELVDKLVKRGERERDALRKLIRREVEDALKALNLPTRSELHAIERRLDAILHHLESGTKPPADQ
ncbi:MAG: phasin family protein [Fimbriimonadales bacterium]|nr:phasin family protein [Fimbriimonadales bacterium]